MSDDAQRSVIAVIGACVRRGQIPCYPQPVKRTQATSLCAVFGECMAGAEGWLPVAVTDQDVWSTCERGEWIMGILAFLHLFGAIPRQVLTLAACAAARTTLAHVPAEQTVPLDAIKAAEAWARGDGSTFDVMVAVTAADVLVLASERHGLDRDAAWMAARSASDAATTAVEDELFAPEFATEAASVAAIYAVSMAIEAAGEDVDQRSIRSAEIATAVRSAVPWSIAEPAIAATLRKVRS